MKPDWKDAPEWANWVAKDNFGTWKWFRDKPFVNDNEMWLSGGPEEYCSKGDGFEESLEPRPV
jgi:hypothetical protein